MVRMALCVAFCCVTAYLSFPLPFTPGMVTALTVALSVTAYVLPPKDTFYVVFAYLFLGLIGLPVYASGASGAGKLFGPVGGFMLAWLAAYPLLSWLKGSKPLFKRYVAVNIVLVMPLTYLGGMISMSLCMDLTPWQALAMGSFPFIPGDILKSILAAFIGVRLAKMKV